MGIFKVTITPRVSETDMLGHVNNTSVAVWFEEFRVKCLEALRKAGEELPILEVALVSVTIDYLGETFHGSDVEMSLRSIEMGNTSLTLCCDMYQEGRHVVGAKAVLVQWDPQTRCPRKFSDRYRKRVEHFLSCQYFSR